MRNLRDHFTQLLDIPAETLKAVNQPENLKHSKDRNIKLYTIRDLDKIEYDEDYPSMVRFVVTDKHRLIIAKAGRPSKTIPQHQEMLQSAGCIAAGRLYLSNETPRRVIKATHLNSSYQSDSSTLFWLLTILDLNPTLIHPEFTIPTSEYDASKNAFILNELTMNAKALQGLLESVWKKCAVDYTTLRQQIMAENTCAKKDTTQHHTATFWRKRPAISPLFPVNSSSDEQKKEESVEQSSKRLRTLGYFSESSFSVGSTSCEDEDEELAAIDNARKKELAFRNEWQEYGLG